MIDYFDCHPLDGYRRLTFMMLDEDVVAVSPSTTYRVLSKAGRLDRWNPKPSKKGTGFVQPLRAHQHWHTDISYLNLGDSYEADSPSATQSGHGTAETGEIFRAVGAVLQDQVSPETR